MSRTLCRLDALSTRGEVARAFLLLFGLSLAVGLTVGFAFQFKSSPQLLEMDEQEYWTLASQILGGTMDITPRRTIGFPLLLAALRTALPGFLAVQIAVAALYALSPPLLFLLVRKLSGSSVAGIAAGAWLALWPSAIFYGTSLYSESAALPIFLLSLLALPIGAAVRGTAPTRPIFMTFVAGLVLGLAAHVRPMYLLFTPFLAIIILVEERRARAAALRILAAAAGFMVVVGPWAMVQTSRFGHPIILTSNGGETLAGGLNPSVYEMADEFAPVPSGRTTWVGPGKWVQVSDTGYLTEEELALPYDAQDRLLQQRTLDWLKANPGKGAYLELRKLTYMWGIYPIARNGMVQALFGNLPTLALLLVAIGLMVTERAATLRLVRFAILPLFVSLVALISWGSWRFRQPGDVGLIALVVVILYWRLAPRFRSRVRTQYPQRS